MKPLTQQQTEAAEVKPLTQQLSEAIMASTGKFASEDFFYICDSRGMVRGAATKQIRVLLQENKIELAGYRKRQDIRGVPLYKVKEGVKPTLKPKVVVEPKALQAAKSTKSKVSVDKHYHALKTKERAEKEKHAKLCADRLEATMRGWK